MRKLFLLMAAAILFSASSAKAQSVYTVTMNTAPLAGHGTVMLDLQLLDGSGLSADLNNNTVTLSDFNFGTGGASLGNGVPTNGAIGNLATSVTLQDSAFFNEYFESFTPGSSLSFTVTTTNVLNPDGTPDLFTFAILDSNGNEIPTTGFANEFLSVSLEGGSAPQVSANPSAPNVQPALDAPSALLQNSGGQTTTIISPVSVVYGNPASVRVAVNTLSGTASGNVQLSVDGGPAMAMALTSGSAVFGVGVLNAGSHSLSASFGTQGSFQGSTANGTLTVTQAPLTLTANNASKVYGAAVPALGFTPSGFVNGDTPASLATQPTLSTTATAASPVGSYAITISGAVDANYSITYVAGTLIVTAAPLTITANSVTKILDSPNPSPLGWTPSGFVNGDTVSALTNNPNCTTTATTTSPVGSYTISCSGAVAANYTFSYVAGTLKVQYATSIGHVILPPMNADGSSVFNQGRTIPAKFAVYDANGVSIGTPGVVSSFLLTGIASGTTTASVQNVVDTNNPDTAFRWDPSGQQWIFNITTANLAAGSTYIYTIALNDGSTIIFQYGLR